MSETIVVNIPEKEAEGGTAVEALQDTVQELAETVTDLAEKVGDAAPASPEPVVEDTTLAVTVGALVSRVDTLMEKVEGLEGALAAALAEPEPEPDLNPVPVELPPVPEEPPAPPTFMERCSAFFRDLID